MILLKRMTCLNDNHFWFHIKAFAQVADFLVLQRLTDMSHSTLICWLNMNAGMDSTFFLAFLFEWALISWKVILIFAFDKLFLQNCYFSFLPFWSPIFLRAIQAIYMYLSSYPCVDRYQCFNFRQKSLLRCSCLSSHFNNRMSAQDCRRTLNSLVRALVFGADFSQQ